MSLLHPTPGQVIDRMSIIRLKLRASPSNERLNQEWKELAEYLNNLPCPDGEAVSLSERLHEVHSELWDCENGVRSEDEHIRLAMIAKKIALLNDERNRLIQEIDKAYGSSSVEDKVYN